MRLSEDARQLEMDVRGALLEKKAMDPVVLDVRGLSGITDFFIIATGGSPPHLKALAAEVHRRRRAAGQAKGRVAGAPDSGWMVIDLGDAVVHLFLPETRAYYGIETLWSDAPRIS